MKTSPNSLVYVFLSSVAHARRLYRYLWPLIHYHKFLAKCIKKLKRNGVDVKVSLSPVGVFLREEVCAVSDHLASVSLFESERWMDCLAHFEGWSNSDKASEARLRIIISDMKLRPLNEPGDVDSPLLRHQIDEQFLRAMVSAREAMNGVPHQPKKPLAVATTVPRTVQAEIKSQSSRPGLPLHPRTVRFRPAMKVFHWFFSTHSIIVCRDQTLAQGILPIFQHLAASLWHDRTFRRSRHILIAREVKDPQPHGPLPTCTIMDNGGETAGHRMLLTKIPVCTLLCRVTATLLVTLRLTTIRTFITACIKCHTIHRIHQNIRQLNHILVPTIRPALILTTTLNMPWRQIQVGMDIMIQA